MDKVSLKNKVIEQEKRIQELESNVASLVDAVLFLMNWSKMR